MERLLFFLFLFLVEFVYIKLALKFKIVDIPNSRSSHTGVIVRGGGVVYIVAVLLFTFFCDGGYPFFIFGLILISIISFADDVCSLSPKFRLIMQILSVLIMFEDVNIYTYPLLCLALGCIVSVYVLNVYNFMDGINGMTGFYSLVVLFSFELLNRHDNYINASLIELLAMSIVVFGLFNFRVRARCFAGDVGSIGMGYCILFIMLKIVFRTHEPAYLIMGIVYGMDVTLTLIHRILLRENIFQPHRMFLFQLLANEGHCPQLIVSVSYALLQLLISLGIIYLPINKKSYFVLVFMILAIVYLFLVKKLFPKHLDHFSKA